MGGSGVAVGGIGVWVGVGGMGDAVAVGGGTVFVAIEGISVGATVGMDGWVEVWVAADPQLTSENARMVIPATRKRFFLDRGR